VEPLLQCIKQFHVAVDSELSTICFKAFVIVLVAAESYLCWSLSVLQFFPPILVPEIFQEGHDPASSWVRCGAGAACDVGVL
jgi:hypothetical protein